LGILGDRQAIPLLEWVLKNKLSVPWRVRERVPASLAAIEGREAVSMLRPCALDRNEHPNVSAAAAIAFVKVVDGRIDDIAIVEAINKYNARDDNAGYDAMLTIAKHGNTKAVRSAAQRHLSKDDIESLKKGRLFVTPEEVSEEAKRRKN
jgi:hypothetical protein